MYVGDITQDYLEWEIQSLNWPSLITWQDFQWRDCDRNIATNNIHPTICLAFEMYWDKFVAEIVRVAKEWLIQPETHTLRKNSPLILPGGSEPRSWKTQRPITQLKQTNKHQNKKINQTITTTPKKERDRIFLFLHFSQFPPTSLILSSSFLSFSS